MAEQVPQDIFEYALKIPCGQKRRRKHCKADASMLVNHTLDGVSCYCFRCGLNAFTAHKSWSLDDVVRRTGEWQAAQLNSSILSLPKDYTLDVPPYAMTWYLKCGISAEEARRNHIGWSEGLKRVIIPVYEPSEHPHISGDVLTNIQMRAVLAGMKPKYIVPGGNTFRNSMFWSRNKRSDFYVVVEDVLSAIKVGQWFSSCAILGTDMTDVRAAKIAERCKKVVLWFDNDKAGNAAKVNSITKLSMCGVDIHTVVTEDDPKKCTRDKAIALIGEAMNA